jgi:(p)ppGpp synthase/HD superfamily hydrolase
MMYSYRIEQAIRAAGVLHKDQVRKGKVPFPYVTHPFAVACIIADYTDNENIIIAGLLHDTIEDTEYTLTELEEDFGYTVCAIVKEVTAPSSEENWKEKHTEYVAQLKNASDEALVVAAADKIHNIRSIIEEYYNDRARFQKDFGGTENERLMVYQSIGNILNSRLQNEIVHEFNHVFDEYKKFIYATQEKNA